MDPLNDKPNTPAVSTTAPLSGVRVLDFCHFLAGPYGTLILAELGADVIKIEDPDHPDEARLVGPHFQGDQSLYFATLNRGKRSVSARLSRPEGRHIVCDLLRTADVVVDNFRPGVMAKLGLDPEALRRLNPAVVSCSLSGFGASGPYASRVGYDYTIQALTGVMSMTGEPDGPPGKAGISYVDHSGGLAIALAVCAALFDRGHNGQGRHIDLGLLDIQTSMLTYLAAWGLNREYVPERARHGAHPSLVPAQTFPTRDGHLSLFIGNDAMWKRLVHALDDPRLADTELESNSGRSRQRNHVLEILSTLFAAHNTAHWNVVLTKAGVPCAPVNTLNQALNDPQVKYRNLVVSAHHPQYGDYRCTRGPLPHMASSLPLRGAPLPGEHTSDVLNEIGYTTAQIAALLNPTKPNPTNLTPR
jgi:crotonobetainyl-CoA:carnitine CoA-transferase CaiB-like acyl-CoA transferase